LTLEVTGIIEESIGDFAAHGYGIWLVEFRSGAGLVGTAGLRPLEDSGLEILYSLASGAWGRGYVWHPRLMAWYGWHRSDWCPFSRRRRGCCGNTLTGNTRFRSPRDAPVGTCG
jgi:hypothetical protein